MFNKNIKKLYVLRVLRENFQHDGIACLGVKIYPLSSLVLVSIRARFVRTNTHFVAI